MPQIIPIKDLKNTAEISELCHRSEEPVYITKNGYGDMAIRVRALLRKWFGRGMYPTAEIGRASCRERV